MEFNLLERKNSKWTAPLNKLFFGTFGGFVNRTNQNSFPCKTNDNIYLFLCKINLTIIYSVILKTFERINCNK